MNFNLIISQTQATDIFSSSWAVLRQAHTNDCPENFLDVQTAVYLQYVYSLCLEGNKNRVVSRGRPKHLAVGVIWKWGMICNDKHISI